MAEQGANRELADDFAGRPGVAVVTGGSGGLGAEICRLLAARGSDVALTYNRNADAAAKVVGEIEAHGRRAKAWQLALDDEAATAAFLDEVVAEFGAVHTLVYASGPHVPSALHTPVGHGVPGAAAVMVALPEAQLAL